MTVKLTKIYKITPLSTQKKDGQLCKKMRAYIGLFLISFSYKQTTSLVSRSEKYVQYYIDAGSLQPGEEHREQGHGAGGLLRDTGVRLQGLLHIQGKGGMRLYSS